MNWDKLPSWARLARRGFDRRSFIQNAASAGAGLIIGSEMVPTASADEEEGERRSCEVVPRAIPHLTTPPCTHFFFPGPVDADATTSPIRGHDPSLITDFSGVIANAEMVFSGKGTDLNTSQTATYDFHADMRFMSGVFVGLDNEQHKGTFGFI